eukprot:131818-Pelagomonas_calceolata.AAC.1
MQIASKRSCLLEVGKQDRRMKWQHCPDESRPCDCCSQSPVPTKQDAFSLMHKRGNHLDVLCCLPLLVTRDGQFQPVVGDGSHKEGSKGCEQNSRDCDGFDVPGMGPLLPLLQGLGGLHLRRVHYCKS